MYNRHLAVKLVNKYKIHVPVLQVTVIVYIVNTYKKQHFVNLNCVFVYIRNT